MKSGHVPCLHLAREARLSSWPATSDCSDRAAGAPRLTREARADAIRLAASHGTSPARLMKQLEVVGNQYYIPRTQPSLKNN